MNPSGHYRLLGHCLCPILYCYTYANRTNYRISSVYITDAREGHPLAALPNPNERDGIA